MPTPFPGVDPYLEHPDLWQNVHNSLIIALRDDLAPRLRPRYFVAVEERTYVGAPSGLTFVGRPDVAAVRTGEPASRYQTGRTAAGTAVTTGELPVLDIVRETYLEVRARDTDRVVTVLEILSPSNKLPGEGREQYERKRLKLLGTLTNLVEIDLLRAGPPMTMRGDGREAHYRILVSRSLERPQADLLAFSVRQPIPDFPLPLQPGEEEPIVEINRLLHELYDRAGYDLRIDYRSEPEPSLEGEDAAWADALLRQAGLR
jgi:hypothetical protein